MADFNFKIKTEADLKALEDARKGLEETKKAQIALGQSSATTEEQISKVDAALQSEAANAVRSAEGLKKAIAAIKASGGNAKPLEDQLRQTKKDFGLGKNPVKEAADFLTESAGKLPGADTIQKIFNGSTRAVAGFAVVLAGATKGLNEFAQAEQRVAGLDAALSQNGQLTDAYREQLQELAGELQKTTGVADDKWIGVLTRLTQFGAKPETIGMDVEAVKNLAGLLGGDIEQAAQAYSKALQGQYEMFGRMGLKIDETASQTEKLKQLQEQAAQRGGGQLEASNKTLIGQWSQLKNNMSDFFEAIGRWLAGTGLIQKTLYGLATTVGWLAQQMGGAVPQVEGLTNKLQRVGPTAAETEKALKKYGEQMKEDIALSQAYEDALLREVAAIQRKQRALDEVTDAEMAARLAAVDQLERDKKMTPSEAIRARGEIRAGAENQKKFNALKAAADQIAALEQEISRKEQELADAGKQLDQAAAAKAKIDAANKATANAETASGKDLQYWKMQLERLKDYRADANPFASLNIPELGADFSKLTGVPGRETSRLDDLEKRIALRIYQAEKAQRLAIARASDMPDVKVTDEDKALAATLPEKKKTFSEASTKNQADINRLRDAITAQRDSAPKVDLDLFKNPLFERFRVAGDVNKAQREAIGNELPDGSKVTPWLAGQYQQIAQGELAQRKALDVLAEYIKKNGYVNATMLSRLEEGQKNLDALIKRIDSVQKQTDAIETKLKHRD